MSNANNERVISKAVYLLQQAEINILESICYPKWYLLCGRTDTANRCDTAHGIRTHERSAIQPCQYVVIVICQQHHLQPDKRR